ncbi:MAG: DUF2299 family protein [Thermoanaerobaculia bacterium]
MDSEPTARERIEAWLTADGWTAEEAASPDAAWLLVAVHPSQIRLQVGQKTEHPQILILQASVSLSEEHRQQLEALAPSLRAAVLWDLRIDLLRSGFEFDGLGEPLDRVRLHRRLFVEDLTRTGFLERVDALRHLVLLVITRVSRALAEPGAAPAFDRVH